MKIQNVLTSVDTQQQVQKEYDLRVPGGHVVRKMFKVILEEDERYFSEFHFTCIPGQGLSRISALLEKFCFEYTGRDLLHYAFRLILAYGKEKFETLSCHCLYRFFTVFQKLLLTAFMSILCNYINDTYEMLIKGLRPHFREHSVPSKNEGETKDVHFQIQEELITIIQLTPQNATTLEAEALHHSPEQLFRMSSESIFHSMVNKKAYSMQL